MSNTTTTLEIASNQPQNIKYQVAKPKLRFWTLFRAICKFHSSIHPWFVIMSQYHESHWILRENWGWLYMLFTHNSSEQVVRAKWKKWFFEEKLAFWAISRAKSTKKWKPPQVNLNPDIEHQNAAKHCKITFYIVFIRYFDHKTHNEHVFATFQVFVTCIFLFIDAQSFCNFQTVSDDLW